MKSSNLFKNHFVTYCFLIFLIPFLTTIFSFATTYDSTTSPSDPAIYDPTFTSPTYDSTTSPTDPAIYDSIFTSPTYDSTTSPSDPAIYDSTLTGPAAFGSNPCKKPDDTNKPDGTECNLSGPTKKCCGGVCCTASLLGCCDKDGDGTNDCSIEGQVESCPKLDEAGAPVAGATQRCCKESEKCCNYGTPNAICCLRENSAHIKTKCCYLDPRCVPEGTLCKPYCGDSEIQGDEFCDGYANCPFPKECSADCKACCGDGFTTPPEECDDGNTANCDGCKGDCTRPDKVCGDGIKECGEQCEPPGTSTCNYQCKVLICGDGRITPPETCDDGNIVSGDGCSATCYIEQCTERRHPNCNTALYGTPCGPTQWCISKPGAIPGSFCVCTRDCATGGILVGANCSVLGRCPGDTINNSTCTNPSSFPPCACPTITTGNACTNEAMPSNTSCSTHFAACPACHYVAGTPPRCSCSN